MPEIACVFSLVPLLKNHLTPHSVKCWYESSNAAKKVRPAENCGSSPLDAQFQSKISGDFNLCSDLNPHPARGSGFLRPSVPLSKCNREPRSSFARETEAPLGAEEVSQI